MGKKAEFLTPTNQHIALTRDNNLPIGPDGALRPPTHGKILLHFLAGDDRSNRPPRHADAVWQRIGCHALPPSYPGIIGIIGNLWRRYASVV
ncbi:hypothetical protein [Candidatus Sodalis sp. SoCistrobi]|uniref:hypothetical protein n=1 Tax=Candidatus Sodalis sp. SoCistrobi TaxID=1922216 RepID=UPI00093A96B1|nr:hypothetical protein [Candidatus Sodalis sp. SoCistrobi]